ncbi:MAG: GNAT family N-acetyltransferase [Burkholderiales bacterium]
MQAWLKEDYLVSTDPSLLDVEAIHAFLTRSYWAEGIAKSVVARAIEHSLCFGLYQGKAQIGYARVITDRTAFAYLCDVYVLDAHRGKGLGKWLIECVVSHRDLQGVRRFCLFTKDAHGLYRRVGFTPMVNTDRYMEIFRPEMNRTRQE